MTLNELKDIVSKIHYKNWKFHILEKGDGFLLQVKFESKCVVTGKDEIQSCRKWYISSHSTKSEVVGTAFKACLTAEEHEVRENFTYKSVRIFNSHVDMDYLAKVMWERNNDTRK